MGADHSVILLFNSSGNDEKYSFMGKKVNNPGHGPNV